MRVLAPRLLVVATFILAGCAIAGDVALARSSHASGAAITAVKVSGGPTRPVFTITGHGLSVPAASPKASPSRQSLCPLNISGNAGLDYGTQFSLLAWAAQIGDTDTLLYAAGRYRPKLNELDCIGIVVLSHTPTRIAFTLGHAYVQYYRAKPRLLRNGDVIEIVLRGARFATVVRF